MCRNSIMPGDRYRTLVGIEDGSFAMMRSHFVCPPDADEIRAAEEEARREYEQAALDEIRRAEIQRAQRGIKKPLATGRRYESSPPPEGDRGE
jgi:phosphoglycolate phosphatase-like HAD superfamily hydrolase